MKKYKLLKWFPTLPKDWEVGMELGVGENRICNYSPCSSKYKDYYLLPADVENNPEFFEEIVEKEYEVLSLKADECPEFTFVLRENGLYSTKGKGSQTLESLLHFSWKINSIRRLSDNEVFSIGDLVIDKKLGMKIPKKITKIRVIGDAIAINGGEFQTALDRIEKAKPVLFITEDNVEVFEGEDYLAIDPKDLSIVLSVADQESLNSSWLKFSSKEKAQEWIVLNKPVLSINDVLNFLEHKTLKPVWNWDKTTPSFIRDIKELVKSRL